MWDTTHGLVSLLRRSLAERGIAIDIQLFCMKCGSEGVGWPSLVPCFHHYDQYSVKMTGLDDPMLPSEMPISIVHRLGDDQLFLTYSDGEELYQLRMPKNLYAIPLKEDADLILAAALGQPQKLPFAQE